MYMQPVPTTCSGTQLWCIDRCHVVFFYSTPVIGTDVVPAFTAAFQHALAACSPRRSAFVPTPNCVIANRAMGVRRHSLVGGHRKTGHFYIGIVWQGAPS